VGARLRGCGGPRAPVSAAGALRAARGPPQLALRLLPCGAAEGPPRPRGGGTPGPAPSGSRPGRQPTRPLMCSHSSSDRNFLKSSARGFHDRCTTSPRHSSCGAGGGVAAARGAGMGRATGAAAAAAAQCGAGGTGLARRLRHRGAARRGAARCDSARAPRRAPPHPPAPAPPPSRPGPARRARIQAHAPPRAPRSRSCRARAPPRRQRGPQPSLSAPERPLPRPAGARADPCPLARVRDGRGGASRSARDGWGVWCGERGRGRVGARAIDAGLTIHRCGGAPGP
jgi:hypothetical protein